MTSAAVIEALELVGPNSHSGPAAGDKSFLLTRKSVCGIVVM